MIQPLSSRSIQKTSRLSYLPISIIASVPTIGYTPLADGLLTKDQLDKPEYTAPLDLAFCPDCGLVQITVSVPPEILFCQDYPYFSSVSPSLMKHFGDSAQAIITDRGAFWFRMVFCS